MCCLPDCCHGAPPAMLPTVVIGNHDLSLESHNAQDLEAHADLLWNIRSGASEGSAAWRLQIRPAKH